MNFKFSLVFLFVSLVLSQFQVLAVPARGSNHIEQAQRPIHTDTQEGFVTMEVLETEDASGAPSGAGARIRQAWSTTIDRSKERTNRLTSTIGTAFRRGAKQNHDEQNEAVVGTDEVTDQGNQRELETTAAAQSSSNSRLRQTFTSVKEGAQAKASRFTSSIGATLRRGSKRNEEEPKGTDMATGEVAENVDEQGSKDAPVALSSGFRARMGRGLSTLKDSTQAGAEQVSSAFRIPFRKGRREHHEEKVENLSNASGNYEKFEEVDLEVGSESQTFPEHPPKSRLSSLVDSIKVKERKVTGAMGNMLRKSPKEDEHQAMPVAEKVASEEESTDGSGRVQRLVGSMRRMSLRGNRKRNTNNLVERGTQTEPDAPEEN